MAETKIIKTMLTPLSPYFLGTDRIQAFDFISQLSKTARYFVRSSVLPSQTALFGILRYLGIREVRTDYDVSGSEDQIGASSFSLEREGQSFGMIRGIGPLMLQDGEGRLYIPCPESCLAAPVSDEPPKKQEDADHNPVQARPWAPYRTYSLVTDLTGRQVLLPEEYDAKSYRGIEFLRLEDGAVVTGLFDTQTQVGINRQVKKDGFFKKEYVRLAPGYRFVFYATVDAGFTCSREKTVYVGQGRAPFSVETEQQETLPDYGVLKKLLSELTVSGGEDGGICAAVAVSDISFSGELSALKQHCALMLGHSRDHRSFSTNYGAGNRSRRYSKHETLRHFLTAGSVFLFRSEEDRTRFLALLEQDPIYNKGKIAGYNCLWLSERS